MDIFDTAILNLLRDGKPRQFQEILTAVKFSHNTLRQHLDSLIEQKDVTRSKRLAEGRGRPRFTYSAKIRVGKVPGLLPSPLAGVVSLSFERLSQVCRFEKGGWCKKIRVNCELDLCPQIGKWV